MSQHGTVEALVREAEDLLREGELEAALSRSQRAADAAAGAGEMEQAAQALLTMAQTLYVAGAEDATRDLALYALWLARAKGAPETAEQAQSLLLTLYAGALALQPLLAGVRSRHQVGLRCGPFPPILAPTLEAR